MNPWNPRVYDINVNSNDPRSGSGCKDLKECVQINKELDTEFNKLKHLRQKYSMDGLKDIQDMYMINPNKEDLKSRFVRFDPGMYNLDTGMYQVPCQDEQNPYINGKVNYINPNAFDTFKPDLEELMMYPKSNVPMRKVDFEEKNVFRIYPHMYQQPMNTEDEADTRAVDFGRTLGGVDYPIPMYFQLRPLQDNTYKTGGIDYDMRLQNKTRLVPNPVLQRDLEMSIKENVDYERVRANPNINALATDPTFLSNFYRNSNKILSNSRESLSEKKPWTVGVPNSSRAIDWTCKQQYSKQTQNELTTEPPRSSYLPGYGARNGYNPKEMWSMPQTQFTTTSEACAKEKYTSPECEADRQSQILMPIGKTEKSIFGEDLNRCRPKYQTYPSQVAFKTGFFELGPAIPPPNPTLLSNVPSNVLVPNQPIVIPDNTPNQPGENLSEGFTGDNLLDDPPRTSRLALNADGSGTARATRGSQYEIVSPNTENDPSVEYSQRNKSLESELQSKIVKLVEQQREIWMQISELRYQADQLKQRELDAKSTSNMIDISESIRHFGGTVELLNRLRQVQSYLERQQSTLMTRLKIVSPFIEYQTFEKTILNRISHYKTEIKQFNEMPADDEVYCYTLPNFAGDAYQIKIGFYDYPGVAGLGPGKLRSMKVGKDVTVMLYQSYSRQGKVIVYNGPKRVHNLPSMWQTSVNGIEVVKKITTYVQLFDSPFYQGGTVKLVPGFYDYPQVGGIGSGRLNSMVIPEGLTVRLYSRPNKQGETVDFNGPQKLSFLPSGWNKKVLGIEIK